MTAADAVLAAYLFLTEACLSISNQIMHHPYITVISKPCHTMLKSSVSAIHIIGLHR